MIKLTETSIMHKSICKEKNPTSEDEKYLIIHTGIVVEELFKIEEYKDKGYLVKIIDDGIKYNDIIRLELTKERNHPELITYRIERVERILSYFKKELINLGKIQHEKSNSLLKRKERLKALNPLEKSFVNKYLHKLQRLELIENKIIEINNIMDNYEQIAYKDFLNYYENYNKRNGL